MTGFPFYTSYPSLATPEMIGKNENITFYYEKGESILYLHFETTYDNFVMTKILEESISKEDSHLSNFVAFNSHIKTSFARVLLFAIQVCHLIVLVETSDSFDSSYLSLFKSLKVIREKFVLKFLPKFLKNSNVGAFMGKEGRLCSPRFIFYFEKCHGFSGESVGSHFIAFFLTNFPFFFTILDETKEILKQYEFDVEDDIYRMLRNEFIITNNSSMSLFSIPRNKRFVFFNTNERIRSDPLMDSIGMLTNNILYDDAEDYDLLRPFKGYARPWNLDTKQDTRFDHKNERNLSNLLKEHANEALQYGFDDSMAKFRGKSHFVLPTMKSWYDSFKIMHKLFIENPNNPDFEANDSDYKNFLDNFHKMMDTDERFYVDCCQHGFECAIARYKEMLPHHYNSDVHEERILLGLEVFYKFAKGPEQSSYEEKFREYCEMIWVSGKQQCEYPSLRGNVCVLPKHIVTDGVDHSSGVVIISTCNCGRIQGHRDDPFTIKQANYDFYQIIGNSCPSCNKLEKMTFPVFEPSINDFRAAELMSEKSNLTKISESNDEKGRNEYLVSQEASQPLESSRTSLSDSYLHSLENETVGETRELLNEERPEVDGSDDSESGGSVKEIVIKVGDTVIKEKTIVRQPSTTEYLPGMIHTMSPMSLLPQFPSWSLVCIGPSSIYSHSTGLPEHVQSGFLTGANFLLPWDVQVRLEHAAEWAANYEKSRNRKKAPSKSSAAATQVSSNPDSVFSLKIFVGIEYECRRGHRFIMSGPDKILRSGGSIVRDNGSKIVFNDMPLYYPCPCRTSKQTMVGQLMRVHVVTPKAPVNVILEPKIKPNGRDGMVFVTGLPEPAKLTQSSYWILRFPYIYQGDDGPIIPPNEVTPSTAMLFGTLQAGMFGISETEKNLY